MSKSCTCNLAMRMNSTVAAIAIEELRKYDTKTADYIIAIANQKMHKDWCGEAGDKQALIPVETNE